MDFERLSQKDLARAIGFSVRTIRDWKDCPRNPDGSYSTKNVVQWLLDRTVDDSVAVEADPESRKWLSLYRKERYLLAKLDREEREGKLISFDDVGTAWGRRMSEVSSGLDMLAYRLPPLIEGRDQDGMRREITAEIQRLKTAYCRRGRFCDYGGEDLGERFMAVWREFRAELEATGDSG